MKFRPEEQTYWKAPFVAIEGMLTRPTPADLGLYKIYMRTVCIYTPAICTEA